MLLFAEFRKIDFSKAHPDFGSFVPVDAGCREMDFMVIREFRSRTLR